MAELTEEESRTEFKILDDGHRYVSDLILSLIAADKVRDITVFLTGQMNREKG